MVKKLFKIISFSLFIFHFSFGLTLDEAINLAKRNYPQLKSEEKRVLSTEFSYKAQIFNFFPTISYSFDYTRYRDINPLDYFSRSHSLILNWTVYNSGSNIISYKLEKNRFFYQKQEYNKELINLIYSVKKTYLTAVAKGEILRYRQIQLKSAEIDYNLALEKFKLGLVKKSDVLNAKVRYENAKYLYIQSKADYQISIAELNSLLGLPLEREIKLEQVTLYKYCKGDIGNFEDLYKKLLKNRPLIKSLKYKEKIASLKSEREIYSFSPKVSLFFQKNKIYNSLTGNDNYNFYGIRLDWLIFYGLGRYNRYISSKYEENATKYEVKETLRKLKLNLFKLYIDYKKNLEKVKLAKDILEKAEENYKQTLGEYKVGKNDIVALVGSESSLADAQINLVNSVLNLDLSMIELEKEIGKIH